MRNLEFFSSDYFEANSFPVEPKLQHILKLAITYLIASNHRDSLVLIVARLSIVLLCCIARIQAPYLC